MLVTQIVLTFVYKKIILLYKLKKKCYPGDHNLNVSQYICRSYHAFAANVTFTLDVIVLLVRAVVSIK